MDLLEWRLNNSIRSMLCCKRYASALMRYGGYFDVDAKAARLEALNTELEDPNVWNSSERAQALGKEKKGLENTVLTLTALDVDTRDARELFDLARADADEAMLTSSAAEARALDMRIAEIEFRRMFDQPADPNHCFIDFQAGAAGTEAWNWPAMLLSRNFANWRPKGFRRPLLE